MVRVRGKAKKRRAIIGGEDQGSSGDDKNQSHRGRGRPQKPYKNEAQRVVEESEKAEEEIDESNENSRKRKRPQQVKESIDSVIEENIIESKSNTDEPTKFVGFRQIGSRRKNKPCRAAEVGVKCK